MPRHKPKPPPRIRPGEYHEAAVMAQLDERKRNALLWLRAWLDGGMLDQVDHREHFYITEKLAPLRSALIKAPSEAIDLVRERITKRLYEEGHMPDTIMDVQPETTTTTTTLTVKQMVERYIQLRDKRDKLKDKHKLELKPFSEVMEKLEGLLMAELKKIGVDSMRSDAGTVFTFTETSVTVKDWSATLDYIRQNELWDLLEVRVAKNAARALIEETNQPVPGVQMTQIETLRVRRA